MNWFQKRLTEATPLKSVTLTSRGRQYKIYFINPAVMELNQSFGHIVGRDIYIRSDLPKSVERFVIHHEVYHLNDTHTWLGWIGKETRANLVCGINDPIGLIATIKASLTKLRLKAYWNVLIHRGIR
jgi:hypothetical protein